MKKQAAPIALCIVGCGAHVEQAYLPILCAIPNCRVESLIDVNLVRCRMLAERYNIGHYSQTIDNIPPTVNAAIVALPHYLHGPVSCELMKKRLHVLCEKPMATTTAEAENMVRCAEENNVHLLIGNIFRRYWTSERVKELIDWEQLGRVVSFQIEAGYVNNWPTTTGFFFDKKKSGGGVLIDIGAHVLDLLLWWLADYPTVINYEDDDFGGVEAECHLELRFRGATTGSVKLSRLRNLENKYSMIFERGSIFFEPYDSSQVCNAITLQQDGRKVLLRPPRPLKYADYCRQQLESFIGATRSEVASTAMAASIIPSIRLMNDCYATATRLSVPWLQPKMHRDLVPGTHGGKNVDIEKQRVLITGASGFIGGRVAERLFFDYGNSARCLARNYAKLARLSRLPTQLVLGDMLDYESLVKASAGCDAVIHCAYGNTGDDALDEKINVLGTENLLRASVDNRVKMFIYLSSVEVYGRSQPPVVDETTEPGDPGNSYARTKLEAEKLCLKYYRESSLPVVVLRLAVVYGPHSPIWTIDVVNRLRNGGFCLSEKFSGLCNPLHVDDCVDAVFLSLLRPDVIGKTFIISGGETVTWNDYFAKYNEILGLAELRAVSNGQLQLYKIVRRVFDIGFKYLRERHGHQLFFAYNRLRERRRIPNLKAVLQKGSLLNTHEIFARQTYYEIEKAKRKLGFEPKYDFDSGMKSVKQWLLQI
jgi:nucleoside-diphosphate-sugar epimerase/predicted dehydrogenase